MEIFKLKNMIGGWFVGNFKETAFNANFEVCYKNHPKGEKWDAHYHKVATEINLLVRGLMKVNDILISPGDIFVILPHEISRPEFLEDCELVVVKTASNTHDKYIV